MSVSARIRCSNKYEAQKLASLIFVADTKETYLKKILNVIGDELVILIKDDSAHSVLFKDNANVEKFADFVQSVIEGDDDIILVTVIDKDSIEIIKGGRE